jgi:hypothetical protein
MISFFKDRLKFELLFAFSLVFLAQSVSLSCGLVSPSSYKVSSGTNNFIFTLEMEAKIINDQNTHACSKGM